MRSPSEEISFKNHLRSDDLLYQLPASAWLLIWDNLDSTSLIQLSKIGLQFFIVCQYNHREVSP